MIAATNLNQKLDYRTKIAQKEQICKLNKRLATGKFNTLANTLAQCNNKKLLQIDLTYNFIRL